MNWNNKRQSRLGRIILTGMILFIAGCGRSPDHQSPIDDATILTVTFAGDLGLGLAVQSYPWIEKNGYHAAFANVRPVIKDTDFFIPNLESPITDPETPSIFPKRRPRQPPEVATALQDEGVTIVGLANNHQMDFGKPGLDSTLKYLHAAGIKTFGAGENLAQATEPLILEKNGYKVAVVAGCRPRKWQLLATDELAGVAPLERKPWSKAIKKAKKKADFVVALPHWGECNKSKISDEEKKYAQITVDAGADLVIGHHPHIPQTMEIIRGVPVLYSIGNFIFHGIRQIELEKGPRNLRFDYSWVTKVEWTRRGLKSITIIPFFNNNLKTDFTPRPAEPKNARWLYERLLPEGYWEQTGNRAVIRFL